MQWQHILHVQQDRIRTYTLAQMLLLVTNITVCRHNCKHASSIDQNFIHDAKHEQRPVKMALTSRKYFTTKPNNKLNSHSTISSLNQLEGEILDTTQNDRVRNSLDSTA